MKKRARERIAGASLAVAVLATALAASSLSLSAEQETRKLGDVNGDGVVNTTDARITLQYAVEKIGMSEDEWIAADVNGDEVVNTTDARLILQYAVEKIDKFPGEKEEQPPQPTEPEPTEPSNPTKPHEPPTSKKEVYPEETEKNPAAEDTWADYTSMNPIFNNIFTADPSAHVWKDGRLYVYPSHDVFPSQGCDLMNQYHVYSTDNMVDWVDHGEILSSDDVEWGREEGGFMWAPDCAYRDGTYYFFYPHPSESNWNDSWKIGVATSNEPAANFKDQGYIQGLPSKDMIDPCVFIDDDGVAYLFVGGGGHCYFARLSNDMMSVTGEVVEITDQLEDFHEGSWVFKREDIYYLVYPDGVSGANQMRYATSDNVNGPWTSRGVILDAVENCETSHGSVVQYRGNWYMFYHNAAISGNGTLRSTNVDQLFFNEDGTIQKVKQTKEGVEAVGPPSESTERDGKLLMSEEGFAKFTEKTTYDLTGAKLAEGATLSGDQKVVENLHNSGAYVEFSGIDGGKGGQAVLTLHYSNGDKGSTMKVDASGNKSDEPYFLRVPGTGGWGIYDEESARCLIDLEPGAENVVRLTGGMGGVNVRGISISLLPDTAE